MRLSTCPPPCSLVGRVKANALDCCSVIVENAFSHAPLDSPKTAAIKQAFFDAGLFTAIKLTLDEALSVSGGRENENILHVLIVIFFFSVHVPSFRPFVSPFNAASLYMSKPLLSPSIQYT